MENLFDLFHNVVVVPSDNDIINIDEHIDSKTNIMHDEERSVRLGFVKPHEYQVIFQFIVPHPR